MCVLKKPHRSVGNVIFSPLSTLNCFLCDSRLEAEIEEARLKAKEEMMQGIQVAKEMAQKELISQKQQYEDRIKVLEKELVWSHFNSEQNPEQVLINVKPKEMAVYVQLLLFLGVLLTSDAASP